MSIIKKIFTLLFCTAIVSAAFAQDDHRDWNNRNDNYANHDRDYNRDGDRRDHGRDFRDHDRRGYNAHFGFDIHPRVNVSFTYQNYRYGFDQRDAVIARITGYYDNQIQQVINSCDLNRWEKRRTIRDLQDQKSAEINNIYSQCGNTASYPGQY